jgi:hypothetical protein
MVHLVYLLVLKSSEALVRLLAGLMFRPSGEFALTRWPLNKGKEKGHSSGAAFDDRAVNAKRSQAALRLPISSASLASPFGVTRTCSVIFSLPSGRVTVVTLCSSKPCSTLT